MTLEDKVARDNRKFGYSQMDVIRYSVKFGPFLCWMELQKQLAANMFEFNKSDYYRLSDMLASNNEADVELAKQLIDNGRTKRLRISKIKRNV